MKKIISMIIIIGLLFSCSVITASAEAPNTTITEENSTSDVISQNPVATTANTNQYQENIDVEYMALDSDFETHYEDADSLDFQINLSSLSEYDYTKVYYASTENVILSDYSPKEYSYSDNLTNLNIEFDIDPDAISKAPLLNFKETTFEKIYLSAQAYDGSDLVDTKLVELSLLPTAYGVFVSEYDDIYAYDKYISYMYTNELITDEEYKYAVRKASELTKVDGFDIEIETEEPQQLKVYNEDTRNVEIREVYNSSNLANVVRGADGEVSLLATPTGGTIVAPEIYVSRSIEALDSGERLRVQGAITWRDISGTWISARNIEVKIMDENALVDSTIATVYTNEVGYYTATFDNRTGILENGLDIYIRINTVSDHFEITPSSNASIFSDGYYFYTETTENVTTSQSTEYYGGSDTDIIRSLSIHQALNVGYHYFKAMNNNDVSYVTLFYPISPEDSDLGVSWAETSNGYIYLLEDDYCDWDVILHELGHHVAAKIDVKASFGQQHGLMENLSEKYGKPLGTQGAWNEGWASYFSMAAQQYYETNVAIISDIVNVADNCYTNLNLGDDGTYSGIKTDYTLDTGITDGNEFAVTAVLYGLILDFNMSHQNVWNIAKNNECKSFTAFMTALYNNIDNLTFRQIGRLLEKHNIADKPIHSNLLYSRRVPGTFEWTAATVLDDHTTNNNYAAFDTELKLVFYDKDFNLVLQTQTISSDLEEYTLTTAQWNTLKSAIGIEELFYWGLVTYQNNAPATGPYYSSIERCYFQEDFNPHSITSLNTGYDDYLYPCSADMFTFTVPENGRYAFYSEGYLDVRLRISTSEAFTVSAIADEDSGEDYNFLYEEYFTAGSTLYLFIDSFDEGLYGQYTIAVSKVMQITNVDNRNLSGETGIWYKFTAPYTGTYYFFTDGEEDTYGNLFNYPTPDGSVAGSLKADDDSGGYYNFKITYSLTKGQTVYLRVRGYDESYEGQFTMLVYYALNYWDEPKEANLMANGFCLYQFTAPSAGNYTFYTTGNLDTYINVFSTPAYDRTSTTGSIASDDNSGDGNNCSVTCYLEEGQVVFIRIRGSYTWTTGQFSITAVRSTS